MYRVYGYNIRIFNYFVEEKLVGENMSGHRNMPKLDEFNWLENQNKLHKHNGNAAQDLFPHISALKSSIT